MDIDERLGLLNYKNDHESHISIKDSDICVNQCKDKPCTVLCPADVYTWVREESSKPQSKNGDSPQAEGGQSPSEQGLVKVQHENCIECGGCRMICPYLNIDCHWPRGGFGVAYKFG